MMIIYLISGLLIGYILGIASFITLIVLVTGKQNKQQEGRYEDREQQDNRSNGGGAV